EQEQAATSTLLIDQMIVEVRADGSYWSEVHQLRRINDLAGVEANTEAAAAAHADQLLLLRTIATDGSSHVPALVNDTFTMPRLEPGAFVEQRHRNFVRAPGPGGWHTPQFFCRSATEPYELTELVLIVPATEPGELRVRNFPGPPTTIALDDGRRALVFRQEHVHRLPPDQHAPALVDLVPVIAFGRDVGMGPVARQTTLAVFGPSRPTPVVTGFAHTLLQGLGSDADKVAAVHRFCQAEIVDGPGDNATATLLRKKGNRFYLALALLRAADVPVAAAAAMPVRAELRREGTPLFVEETPYVLPAALVQPRDGAPSWWFIDSPRHLPLGEVAGARAGARAVVVATDGLQQQRLPANACTVAQTFAVTGQATVGHGGDVLCTARIELADAAAYGLAEELRNLKADVRKLAARQFAQRFFQDWRIEQAEFADLEPAGRPLALQVKVSRRLLQTDGLGRALLQLPLPPGKFLAAYGDREGRELPLHLTGELQSSWQLTVDLGDEYDIAAIPEPVLLDQGLLAYALSFARSGRQLLVQRQTTVRAGTIPLSAFGDWLRVLRTADRSEEQTLRLSARPH
ncbi:MAG TPA: hypothetical protein VK348_07005, partial [Planctomycetota bacterium]|nr:hypothetical protein [Planctomycetota bacterium]